VGLSHVKASNLLCPVKDKLRLKTPGVYRIPCECSRVYIGQTGCSNYIRLKDHQWQIQLEHLDKSAEAEHSISHGHCIVFHNTSILATKTRCMVHIVREATEIEIHSYSINR
jgi:hypothetical protein